MFLPKKKSTKNLFIKGKKNQKTVFTKLKSLQKDMFTKEKIYNTHVFTKKFFSRHQNGYNKIINIYQGKVSSRLRHCYWGYQVIGLKPL
jgi:hypothetical protein